MTPANDKSTEITAATPLAPRETAPPREPVVVAVPSSPPTIWALVHALICLAIHGLLLGILFLWLVLGISHCKQFFRDFHLVLPHLTEWLLGLSDWMTAYLPLAGFLFLVVLGVDFAIWFLLWRLAVTKRSYLWSAFGLLWLLLVSVFALALLTYSIMGIYLPMVKVMEALSGAPGGCH